VSLSFFFFFFFCDSQDKDIAAHYFLILRGFPSLNLSRNIPRLNCGSSMNDMMELEPR